MTTKFDTGIDFIEVQIFAKFHRPSSTVTLFSKGGGGGG